MNTNRCRNFVSCFATLIVFLLSACGRCGWGTYYSTGIKKYSGDGSISDVSQSSGGLGSRGYVIDFPKFDLGKPYQSTYHLSEIPTLGHAAAQISLMIEDSNASLASRVDQLKASSTANLKCSLSDSSGKMITKFEVPLSKLTWSSPIHGRSGYALYELEKSEFLPDSKTVYTLAVEYSGDPELNGKIGWFYVWCGCGGA